MTSRHLRTLSPPCNVRDMALAPRRHTPADDPSDSPSRSGRSIVGVTFWAWLWGIAGALLAVPMLAEFKIVCDEIKPLAPVGEFLGP